MNGAGWLPAPAEELFGAQATAEQSYEVLTVDVPPDAWTAALLTARDELGCTYFDWLSAVDEPGTGFRVCAHVVALSPIRRLLLRTTVPHEAPTLASAVDVYAGAAWHERETHEMFGVGFEGHPALDHLLLPETFEGHPLRKDFVLAARVAKAWPGAKEPGESEHGGPKRRQMLPPGVPDPNEWGPLKGQLPPAPARPARTAGRAAGERPASGAGDRPVRRTRTAAEGSASQAATAPGTAARPRRTRSASQGSVSQAPAGTEGTGLRHATGAEDAEARSKAASEGSATDAERVSGSAAVAGAVGDAEKQAAAPDAATRRTPAPEGPDADAMPPHEPGIPAEGTTSAKGAAPAEQAAPPGDATPGAPAGPRRARSASGGSASQRARGAASGPATPHAAPRSSDAPWHHARPAFEEPEPKSGRTPEDNQPNAGRAPERNEPNPGRASEDDASEAAGSGGSDTGGSGGATEAPTGHRTEPPAGEPTDHRAEPTDHPAESPTPDDDPEGGPR
jgi:NADH:ubiquinone oxidoreductase subunit C